MTMPGHEDRDSGVVEVRAGAVDGRGEANPGYEFVDRIEVGVRQVPGWMRTTGVLVAVVGLAAALGQADSQMHATTAAPSPSRGEVAPSLVQLVADNVLYSTRPGRRQVTVAFRLRNVGSGPVDIGTPQLRGAGLQAVLYSTVPPTASTADLEVAAGSLPPFTPLHMEASSARVLLVRYQITDCAQSLATPATVSVHVNSGDLTSAQAVTLPEVKEQPWSIALAGLTCPIPN